MIKDRVLKLVRRTSRRERAAIVAAILGAVFVGFGPAEAAQLTTNSPGKASCTAAWNDHGIASTYSWASPAQHTFNMRCYYDFNNPPVPTASGGSVFGGTTADLAAVAGQRMCWLRGDGLGLSAEPTGTTGMVWDNLQVQESDPSRGYVQFSVRVKRWSGSGVVHSLGNNFARISWGASCTSGDSLIRSLGGGSSSTSACYLMGCKTVAWSSFTSPLNDPQYRWGDEWSAESPFCGATVEVVGKGDNDLLESGDSVTFSVAYVSGVTQQVWAKFTNVQPWQEIYNSGLGVIANPSERTLTVPTLAYNSTLRVGAIALKCFNEATQATMYDELQDAGDSPKDQLTYPCRIARFYWPANRAVEVAELVKFRLQYSGILPTGMSPTTLTVEYATHDESSDEPVAKFSTMTWTPLASNVPLGTAADYNATAAYAGSVRQFIFRCTDVTGTYYQGQWAAGIRLAPSEDPDDLQNRDESCISSAGLGLNPASWVPGLIRMGSCLLKALFVPSSSAIEGLKASGDQVLERAPFSFVAETYEAAESAVGGLPESVQAQRDGCLSFIESLPAMPEAGQGARPVEEICPSDLDSSDLSSLRELLGWCFRLMYGLALFGMTRAVIAQ